MTRSILVALLLSACGAESLDGAPGALGSTGGESPIMATGGTMAVTTGGSVAATGGSPAGTGGAKATGGTLATGGSVATGGVTVTVATGGTSTGGIISTGGDAPIAAGGTLSDQDRDLDLCPAIDYYGNPIANAAGEAVATCFDAGDGYACTPKGWAQYCLKCSPGTINCLRKEGGFFVGCETRQPDNQNCGGCGVICAAGTACSADQGTKIYSCVSSS
jgi:hypothetical protein